MKKISAEIVSDSINPQGDRITTFLLTFPRFILAELNTHRVFSKNSASSRAIPFKKMVEMVETDPFVPIAWQKDHKGMQGIEYFTDNEMPNNIEPNWFINRWLEARDKSVEQALIFNKAGVTKQICNRLLEPFMWHTVLLTGTEFKNFFELRCPQYLYDYEDRPIYFKSKKDWVNYYNESQGYKEGHEEFTKIENLTDLEWLEINKGQAEIHMGALAEAMYDAMNKSTPKELKEGEWHIPFGDNMDEKELDKLMPEIQPASLNWYIEQLDILKLKVSTARCARLSYMTFDGEIDYKKDLKLHDTLLESQHMSPFEHCARAMSEEEYDKFFKGEIPNSFVNNPFGLGWCNNYRGFIQYRYLIEN